MHNSVPHVTEEQTDHPLALSGTDLEIEKSKAQQLCETY